MASNFHIYSFKTRDSLHIKLTGDFDGSSAHELINTIENNNKGYDQIFVDTSDMKTIYPFGKVVLKKKLGSINKKSNNLILIGENVSELYMI
jgi:ABC-type transporter Mla MlaB component